MVWIDGCAVGDTDLADVMRFDHGGQTCAIYRAPDGAFFATDGLCSHEQVHLADGLVMDHVIECPKHNGRFDVTNGKAKGAPATVDLGCHPVEVRDGRLRISLSSEGPG